MPTRILYPILMFCLLLVSACGGDEVVDGDDDDDDNRPNSASVEVSGLIDGDYDGTATFVSVLGVSQTVSIVLDDGEGSLALSTIGGTSEGTHTIAESADPGTWSVVVTLEDLGQSGAFSSVVLTGGSVTITDLGDDRIEGRFEGSASANEGGPLTVDGDFKAICVDIFGVAC